MGNFYSGRSVVATANSRANQRAARSRNRRYSPLVLAVALICDVAPRAQTSGDLFNTAELHEVRIYMHSRDVERLRERFLENRFYAADVEWRGVRVRNAAVRSRGGGSRNPVKVGLAVEFDRYVTGQTLAGRRTIVLDNLWQDPSMVRERVAMALFARVGQPASLESFARVFINGDYQGIYAIVEAIDADFLTRTEGDPTGSLYEYHWVRPFYFEDLGDDLEPYELLFEPRTNTRAAPAVLYRPLRDMLESINGAADNVWRTAVEQHVDLTQLVAHVAIGAFMSEWDGLLGYAGVNNVYLYRPTGRTYHRFIPWDRDHAFRDENTSIFRRIEENLLVRRALSYPDLYAYYLDVLEQTAQAAAANGWLENEIRTAAAMVSPHVADDPRRPYTVEEHQQHVAALIEFARTRPQDVLRQVADARR